MERELIHRFLTRYRREVWIVVGASVLVNLLVFAGSIYMLLVYDSVLPSGSLPTLFGLFAMLALVYLVQAVFESIRAEALLAFANGTHRDLVSAVRHAAVNRTLKTQREMEGLQLSRDLDQVHTFLAGTGPVAIIDLPWVIVFLVVLAALHWALGLTALVGTVVLACLAWWTSKRTAAGNERLVDLGGRRGLATQAELRFAEAAWAMGMQDRLLAHSRALDQKYLEQQSYMSRTVARLGGASRLFRLFLQSLMLTVGAILVIGGSASGGIILAASVLSGRALAPVDQAIANARSFSAARSGWARIVQAVAAHPRPPERAVQLAPPSGEITVRDIWVVPPGAQAAAVGGVNFTLRPGDVLAIIGPSAAGKSSLAKALLGIWPLARGEIRLGGAVHDQWDRNLLGQSLGYLPQAIDLLGGTVAENIARFDPAASSEDVIAAARAAGLHETILGFPNGYDTEVSPGGGALSAGQRQRIALARALYRDPHLVVLDEPNSNLDSAGDDALVQAIAHVRQRGGIVVMITHRPATLGPVTHVAVLSGGNLADFGERDAVLKRTAQASRQASAQGTGVATVQRAAGS